MIGVIADDITGGTDVALMLTKRGGHVVQFIGLPDGPLPQADAVVISLKTRSCPPAEAVAQAQAACVALQEGGAGPILFKYCSTFDSTDAGNIGPVIDALMTATGAALTVACPAFPANGRTVYQGHLFVGRQLLSDSPMKDHPLTPMHDPDLVAVLQRQTTRRVGLVAHDAVDPGPWAVAQALAAARAANLEMVIVDAITDRHLIDLATGAADLPLLTGGSGLALGLAPVPEIRQGVGGFQTTGGARLILAGSCSARTRAQVAAAQAAGMASLQIDPAQIDVPAAVAWALQQVPDAPVLIYSSADPADVARSVAIAGGADVAARIETCFADIASALVAKGVGQLIVAGGETSGAVLAGLGVRRLAIGPEIAPGVPWTRSLDHPALCIAAKSGNFGAEDFFLTAWSMLDG
jgi:3-dehydrotetronate 4-kinase